MESFYAKSLTKILFTILIIQSVDCTEVTSNKMIYIPLLEDNSVVAKVNNKSLSLAEIKGIELFNQQAEESIVENYRRLTEAQVLNDIIEKESSKAKLSPEAFIRKIEAKISINKTDVDEIKKLQPHLEINKIREIALNKKKKEHLQKYYQELLNKNNFQFLISAKGIEVPISEKIPFQGPVNGKNVIHLFSDFQCPYCKKAAGTIKELTHKYSSKTVVYFHHLPLNFHAQAYGAAIAAQCAHEQNKFWQFHDILFKNQERLNPSMYAETAQTLTLDLEKFKLCQESPQTKNTIEESLKLAQKLGINGTPIFIVNGKKRAGTFDSSELR